jgi:hypothetical protein
MRVRQEPVAMISARLRSVPLGPYQVLTNESHELIKECDAVHKVARTAVPHFPFVARASPSLKKRPRKRVE